MADRPLAVLSKEIDQSGVHEIWGNKKTGKAFIYDSVQKKDICGHRHDFEELQEHLRTKREGDALCPLIGHRGMLGHKMSGLEMDTFFYESLNSPRDYTFPHFLHASMYGNVKITKDLRWKGEYKDFGLNRAFLHEDGKKHTDFEMTFDIFEPEDTRARNVATVVVVHGVPVNRTEWYDVAHLLAPFVRVVCVDLFGMGWASKPTNFKDENGKWLWSWKLHAQIFQKMLASLFKEKVYFVGNDWGAGVVQKFGEMFYKMLHGFGLFSAIMLNSYWVQHIGALQALALLPYPSPTFHAETVRFAGTLTMLLETMFHRTAQIHNQYTMASLQEPYVEISYDDPTKNPANTIYKDHAVRVLAEQASQILGNGELLPRHPTLNKGGIHFSHWYRDGANVLQMHGKNDVMMSEGQVRSFENMVSLMNTTWGGHRITYTSEIVADAGHFMTSDQPEKVASRMLLWIRDTHPDGFKALSRSFWGFNEIARRDELQKMRMWDVIL